MYRIMSKKINAVFLTLFVLLLAPAGAAATTLSPGEVIKDTAAKMIVAIEAEKEALELDPLHVYELVNRIMMPHFDLPLMAKRVLGKHWRRAEVQQRKDFTVAFKKLLVRAYAKSLVNYSELDIRYLPVRKKANAKAVEVRSEVTRPGETALNVVYRLRLKDTKNSTAWKVYDISIDGVSLVLNYKSTFSKEISKGGLPLLIEKISKTGKGNES
ncbi:Uncharacterized ABC transporter, auxiliary component YrbC [hydrothermal vent metagenome]|uniref:Uncharacterized ABC transporter, auxiliary component YrbC n=1 Tax=hydrothermal vent metagenome TaxID=652676 RepID=A0A3B0ZKM6_9ZZZZ